VGITASIVNNIYSCNSGLHCNSIQFGLFEHKGLQYGISMLIDSTGLSGISGLHKQALRKYMSTK